MDKNYIETIESRRAEREEKYRSDPVNWLSLVGRIPLMEGENRVSGEVTVPAVFVVKGNSVELIPDAGSGMTVNGAEFNGGKIATDLDAHQDTMAIGSLVMQIIQRNGTFFLRVWDTQSPALKAFHGFNYFPVKPEYILEAEFETFEEPRVLETFDAIGGTHETAFSGAAHFTWQGVPCRLIAEDMGEEGLLFNFTDECRKDLTYPGGRHLVTKQPVNGKVTLDFNRAENWPCAYTHFATCPLPSFENRLSVRIEAGEQRYHE